MTSVNPYGSGDGITRQLMKAQQSMKDCIGGSIFVGTAGWANPPLEREQRASGQSHLQHYATLFNAVEINSSFYRSHERSTYERWSASTPAGFGFSVKAPRSVTHDSGLRRCRSELDQFLQEIAGLGRKLRVVLVQTPASLEYDPRTAVRFFKSLIAGCSAQIAFEPRHASWFTPRVQSKLRRIGVYRVVADPAKFAGAGRPPDAGRLIYYRLHGSPRMYSSAYTPEYLTELSNEFRALRAPAQEVWCLFDNTARHESWGNARYLRGLLNFSRVTQ
jgi:uncharacterized protein YecE (DUF72 family)